MSTARRYFASVVPMLLASALLLSYVARSVHPDYEWVYITIFSVHILTQFGCSMTMNPILCSVFAGTQQMIGYEAVRSSAEAPFAYYIFSWIVYIATAMIAAWYVVKSFTKCRRRAQGDLAESPPIGRPVDVQSVS